MLESFLVAVLLLISNITNQSKYINNLTIYNGHSMLKNVIVAVMLLKSNNIISVKYILITYNYLQWTLHA